MASITFFVSDKVTTPERLNTEQTFTLKIVSKFQKPPVKANRTYASAMDHKSGRGTLVSSHETFNIEITFKDSEIPDVDELLYSLLDFQIATLNGTDLPKLLADRNFRLIGDSWSFPAAGCGHNRLAFSGAFLP